MIDRDDAKRLFLRDAALGDQVIRQDTDPPIGAPSVLARTKALSTYPTRAACYYGCQPLSLLGPEVEGGSGTIGSIDATFLALNLGSGVPPVGILILATFVGNRWVFRYDA
jgi:hypothetical protein